MGDTHLGNEAETRGQRPEPGGEFEADETIGAIWDEHEVRMAVESLRHGRTGPEVGGESDGDEYAHEEFLSVVVGAMARTSDSTAAALSNTGAVDRVKPKRVADPKAEHVPFAAGQALHRRAEPTTQGSAVCAGAISDPVGSANPLGRPAEARHINEYRSTQRTVVALSTDPSRAHADSSSTSRSHLALRVAIRPNRCPQQPSTGGSIGMIE